MTIFVYSDESGVFDKAHNDVYVYGGVVFLDKDTKDIAGRKYMKAERYIRRTGGYSSDSELKAYLLKNKEKSKLYRSLNQVYKFGVVVDQKKVLDAITQNKKNKERYLDYVYKIGVKKMFQCLIKAGIITPSEVDHIFFFVDEHTTATSGRYELQGALEGEFKNGTFNFNYSYFFPPIFPNLQGLHVEFCNSSKKTLIRAADIVANRIYHTAVSGGSYDAFDPDGQRLHIFKTP